MLIFDVLYLMLSQRCCVSLTFADSATKITPDSESSAPVPYKWSIVMFSLSSTVFELKGTSLHGNTCFRILVAAVWRAVQPERMEKKVVKK